MAGGIGRCGTRVKTTLLAVGTLMAPSGGFPPFGGGWWLYHAFSTQFTTLAPPFTRAHSAKRAPSELPRAGLVRAPPREMASQTKTTARLSPTTTLIRRRR